MYGYAVQSPFMDDDIRERVGNNVRAEMSRRRITQDQVAVELGISQPQVSKRILGEIAFDVVELEKLARLMKVPVEQFLQIAAPASVGHAT